MSERQLPELVRECLVRAVAGPATIVALWLLGRFLGALVGYPLAWAPLLVLATVAAVPLARRTSGIIAFFGWLFGVLSGGLAADGAAVAHALDTGEFVVGASIADLRALRHKAELTFRDADAEFHVGYRYDHVVRRRRDPALYFHCEVYPIEPLSWRKTDPVDAWRVGDDDFAIIPWRKRVFHPTTSLSDECRVAIERAVRNHHLRTVADPVYLEEMPRKTANRRYLHSIGRNAMVFFAGLWFLGGSWSAAGVVLEARRHRAGRA